MDLRILAISHLFPHVAERRYGVFVARQLSAMAEEGADITVLVPRQYCPKLLRRLLRKPQSYDHTLELVDVPGLTAIPIPFFSLPGLWFTRWAGISIFAAAKQKARELHEQRCFDVIYTTELFIGGDAGGRLSKQLGIPSACLAIGGDVNWTAKRSKSSLAHYRRIIGSLDGMLACGESVAEEIRDVRPDPTTLCVYGVVDLDTFSPCDDAQKGPLRRELGLPSDRTLILYVGYLWKEKGLFDLIDAFSRVHAMHPNAFLTICGAGKDERAIKQAASESDASSSIQFVGAVDPDQVHRYMQASDLFTLPSHDEGMPNAVMEAMACGVPVVCTTVGGLAAALADTSGAVLVPRSRPRQLADAIAATIAEPAKLASMATAARIIAEEQFGASKNAKRILAYLSATARRAYN